MFERMNETENIGASARPPRKLQTEADNVHRATYVRSGQLREEMSRAQITEELQDQEPRAILRVQDGGHLVRMEFIESTYTANQQQFLEEYVQAAGLCGDIAVLYPGMSFPEDYVLRMVQTIYERIKRSGVEGDISLHGFLYDFEGTPRELV
jgi:hypothetical protein